MVERMKADIEKAKDLFQKVLQTESEISAATKAYLKGYMDALKNVETETNKS